MSAFNVVRFRVKPGSEKKFVELHGKIRPPFKGFLGGDLIQTGEQTFCMIGKWRSMKALVAARPEMIAVLDQLRPMLEDLGGDLGVTDPVSGESVASLKATKKSKVKSRKAGKKKVAKKGSKKAAAGKKAAKRKAAKKKAPAAKKKSGKGAKK